MQCLKLAFHTYSGAVCQLLHYETYVFVPQERRFVDGVRAEIRERSAQTLRVFCPNACLYWTE